MGLKTNYALIIKSVFVVKHQHVDSRRQQQRFNLQSMLSVDVVVKLFLRKIHVSLVALKQTLIHGRGLFPYVCAITSVGVV